MGAYGLYQALFLERFLGPEAFKIATTEAPGDLLVGTVKKELDLDVWRLPCS